MTVRAGVMWLLAAGTLDALAALLHLACVIMGASWYRALGAGKHLTRLVERGSLVPHIITLGVAGILAAWAAFSFSGAGVVSHLPLLRPALIAICVAYAIRAVAYPLMLKHMPDRSRSFLQTSSLIVLIFAIVHAVGVALSWESLA